MTMRYAHFAPTHNQGAVKLVSPSEGVMTKSATTTLTKKA